MKYSIGLISFLFLCMGSYAQDSATVKEITTGMRADGKIYVVVAVALTILLGLILYLVSLDRKISKLEKHHS